MTGKRMALWSVVDRLLRQNQTTASDGPGLMALTPYYDHREHGVYFSAINDALLGEHSRKIRNIALTGGYGIGKSSILQRVIDEYPKRVVQISLSTLGSSEGSGEVPSKPATPHSKTNRIQKEIVKQLLYREDPAKTPGSRFRRIGRLDLWREVGVACLVGIVLTLGFYLTGWTEQLTALVQPTFASPLGVQAVVFAFGSGLVLATRVLFHNRIRIERVSTGPATISLAQESTTFFDQYLDEIVYFFDVTGRDIVIFEDIDRFDDPNIFEALRALNTLLNGAEQLGRRNIRFIYAIKDSIFDELGTRAAREGGDTGSPERDDAAELALARANRTKFFDLVIPVVPFITHRTARDLMAQLMTGLDRRVSPELIDLAARDVADMRLIKNIRNEFVIFAEKVLPKDGSGLTLQPDSLFAMMVYKSTHLADFEAIRTGASNLDRLYRAGRELVNQNIERLNAEAREARDRLAKLESLPGRSEVLGERLIEYIGRLERHLNVRLGPWSLKGVNFTDEDFRQRTFWEKLIAGEGSLTTNFPRGYGYVQTVTLERSDLTTILGDPLSQHEWEEDERTSLQTRLRSLQEQRQRLSHADMHELIVADAFTLKRSGEPEKTFRQLADEYLDSDLARRLVREGYINRDFTLYTSTFYGERVSSQATNFIMHNIDRNVMDVHFELEGEDVEAVLRERGATTLGERAMYNVAVLDHLLRTEDSRVVRLISSLESYGDDQQRFLQAYLADGNQKDALVEQLRRWPRLFSFLVSDSEVDEAERLHLLNIALKSTAASVSYILGNAVRDYLQANASRFQVLASPDTDAETADHIAKLLVGADAYLPNLEPLSELVRHAVVAVNRYVISRENLVLALDGADNLALDLIKQQAPVVYSHTLSHLGRYVASFSQDEDWPYTVVGNPAFAGILEDVIAADAQHLQAIVSSSSPECFVEDLTTVSKEAWPTLAKCRRFPLTLSNVTAYIEEVGSVDASLASHLSAHRSIEVVGADPSEMLALAEELLAARDLLTEPELRVDLVASLGLEERLPVGSVQPEDGKLIGLLIERELLADDEESFALIRGLDWSTREFAISKSREFASFMTPEDVAVRHLCSLLQSNLVPHTVKSTVLDRLTEFASSADRTTLEAIAKHAVRTDHQFSIEEIGLLADGGVEKATVLTLLVPLLPTLHLRDLQPILEKLGDEYAVLAEPSRKRPILPDTPATQALAERLEQLGRVSSSRPEGGMLRVVMKPQGRGA